MKYLLPAFILLLANTYGNSVTCPTFQKTASPDLFCEDEDDPERELGEWEPAEVDEEDRERREFERVDAATLEKFVRKHMPISAKKLDALGARGLKIMQHECRDAYHHYHDLAMEEPEEAEAHARLFDLEMATHLTGDLIRRAREGGQDTNKSETELNAYLEQLFELKQQQMKREVDHLRRELAELEEVLKERAANKAAVIKRHGAMLSGKRDPLEF